MKKLYGLIAVVALVGVIAYAATPAEPVDISAQYKPLVFEKGIYIGTKLINAPQSTKNKLTKVVGITASSFDLPIIDAGTQWTSGTVAAGGARVGDTCVTGRPATSDDGGTTFGLVSIYCTVSASDVIKFVFTNPSAGNQQPPQQTLTAEIFSNQ